LPARKWDFSIEENLIFACSHLVKCTPFLQIWNPRPHPFDFQFGTQLLLRYTHKRGRLFPFQTPSSGPIGFASVRLPPSFSRSSRGAPPPAMCSKTSPEWLLRDHPTPPSFKVPMLLLQPPIASAGPPPLPLGPPTIL